MPKGLKKIQNAPRPSEHPPIREEKCQNVEVASKAANNKTSSWHLNGFPDGNNTDWVNSIMSRRRLPLYCTFTLIAMQGHQKNIKNKPETMQYTITHGSSNILLLRLKV